MSVRVIWVVKLGEPMYIYWVFRVISSTAKQHAGSFSKLVRVGIVTADNSVEACDMIREQTGCDEPLQAWMRQVFPAE